MSEQENDGLIPPFWGYSAFTPTIPKMYWSVKSQEQRILNLFDLLDKLASYTSDIAEQINVRDVDIAELQELFKKFQESGFNDYYAKQVDEWINSHLSYIYDKAIQQVYFGLTSDGYFCAYVPDSWQDIEFDTGMNYGTYTYGHLILRFNADGSGVIDNTVYGAPGSPEEIKDLRDKIEELRKTVYTALKRGE